MSTVTNPLSGLVEGLLQGHALATQIHQQQQQDQAFKTNQALHEQQMSMQDIMNRQMLADNARPVSAAGTIDSPAVEGAPNVLSGAAGMPDLGPSPGMPAFTRKADASRTVKYGGQQYELKTPEEQRQSAIEDATAKKRIGMTAVQTPAHLKAAGLPDQLWIPDEHLAQYADSTSQGTPVATPQAAQDLGYPAQVPFRNLPAVMSGMGAAAARKDTNTRAAATLTSHEKVAADNRTAADQRAADATASREKIAGGRNATTLEAAQARRENPTPGQAGVESRFEQRRQDQAQKQINDVQAKEDEVHALRTKLGEDLKDPSLSDAQRTVKMGQMKTTAFQVQAYQSRKATLAGAALPPKTIQDKIPEGKQATGPDGHTWRKQGGIVYFVQ